MGRSEATRGEMARARNLALVACVVVCVLVATQHDYYCQLTTVSQVLWAVVPIALWPLILLGASLYLNLAQL